MYRIDGYDEAIIGVAYDHPVSEQRLVYDMAKLVELIMNRDCCSFADAKEWVEYNIAGSFTDTSYPILVECGPVEETVCD